jgi:sialic acid synthase SpsE
MNTFNIGTKKIGKNFPTYVIAEAGINHNGNLEIAKTMIEKAAHCGVDAIKFQTLTPDELFSKTLSPKLFELIKKWSLTKKDHKILKKHAEKNGIDFLSTPIGKKTAKILFDINCKAIKLSSGDLNNFELISFLTDKKIPLIISTGMSTISEITSVMEFLLNKNSQFCFLHTTSSYPTLDTDANLINIKYFQNIFPVPIGYSDHTIGNEACMTAISLGACIIEKHFTLDKQMEGPDQKLSADVNDFSNLVKSIRKIEKMFGTKRIGPINSEIQFQKNMRRSIVFKHNLKKNTILKKSDLIIVRPGIGVSPIMLKHIVGLKIKRNVKEGTLFKWDLL